MRVKREMVYVKCEGARSAFKTSLLIAVILCLFDLPAVAQTTITSATKSSCV